MGRDSFHGDVRMYLFIFPPLAFPFSCLWRRSRSPSCWHSYGPLLFCRQNSHGSFPIFRTLPHPKASLKSPPPWSHDWREQGARAQWSPSAGQPLRGGRCSQGSWSSSLKEAESLKWSSLAQMLPPALLGPCPVVPESVPAPAALGSAIPSPGVSSCPGSITAWGPLSRHGAGTEPRAHGPWADLSCQWGHPAAGARAAATKPCAALALPPRQGTGSALSHAGLILLLHPLAPLHKDAACTFSKACRAAAATSPVPSGLGTSAIKSASSFQVPWHLLPPLELFPWPYKASSGLADPPMDAAMLQPWWLLNSRATAWSCCELLWLWSQFCLPGINTPCPAESAARQAETIVQVNGAKQASVFPIKSIFMMMIIINIIQGL